MSKQIKKSGKQRAKAMKARAEKRAAKFQAMKRSGGSSDYAQKKAEQVNGNFRPTSPFEAGGADKAAVARDIEENLYQSRRALAIAGLAH